jgi:hypothetical protein
MMNGAALPLLEKSEAADKWVPAFAGTTVGDLPISISIRMLAQPLRYFAAC